MVNIKSHYVYYITLRYQDFCSEKRRHNKSYDDIPHDVTAWTLPDTINRD